jgi:hypothetical protein
MLFAGTGILRTNGTYWYFYALMGPMPLHYNINFVFSDPLQFFGYLLVLFTLFNFAGALLGISLAYTVERRKPIGKTSNQRVIPRADEDSTGAKVKSTKMRALTVTIVWALMGASVWDALFFSAPTLEGGAENFNLFLFVSWVGFGILLCYFLGSLTIAILRSKKR